MVRLKIVASGESDNAKANARGKLFENIAAEVLRKYGYKIDKHRANITHAGMEIDIEGHHEVSKDPLCAECKCYSSDINSEKIQTFVGKYTPLWLKNNRTQGIFLAIPGLNTDAMGYYKENYQDNTKMKIMLLQEPDVVSLLIQSNTVVSEKEINGKVDISKADAGDTILICSDKGYFWLQFIIPNGIGIANAYQLFDGKGHLIDNENTVSYLSKLVPEVYEFDWFRPEHPKTQGNTDEDSIVELKGSSSCFEYQLPASPEFFVGRTEILDNVSQFAKDVLENKTSLRGILFEGNSGWGKSSVVLAAVDKLKKMGHYAIAIDSRCANSSRFVLSMVRHVFDCSGDFDRAIDTTPNISGFQGAIDSLIGIGDKLKTRSKLLFIFLDQFENVFYLNEVLQKLSVMLLKITDKSTNVILGFSWKIDLLITIRDFPHTLSDLIINSCKHFSLSRFTDVETNGMLDKLARELHTSLRKDLRFHLSDFSQGYPWLLKKLCAHVKNQRENHVSQADIAKGLLNVDQLFQEDLHGLGPEKEDTLKRIAKLAPVQVSDIGEDLNKDIIQSLIDRRLLVKVGTKYDIYWDIFRDFLNTGKLPIQEVYLMRANFGSCTKSLSILNQNKGQINVADFKSKAGLSDGTYFNVLKDLKLLKLVETKNRSLRLCIDYSDDDEEFFSSVSRYTSDKLKKNHSVDRILKFILAHKDVTIERLASELSSHFPYITASDKTWETYSRVLASWLDLADLAIYDSPKEVLSKYDPSEQIRVKKLTFVKRRRQSPVPAIQYMPVVQVAQKIADAVQNRKAVDWSELGNTTIFRSISMLEDMGLITRKGKSISLSGEFLLFATHEVTRKKIGITTLLEWPYFEKFIGVLEEQKNNKINHDQLCKLFITATSVPWALSTTKTHIKIMLDWARHLGIAPGKFASTHRGPFKNVHNNQQRIFFDKN